MLAAAVLLAGCGDRRPEHTRTAVHDSAGVHIVEVTPGTAEGPAWRVDPRPVLGVGGGPGGLYQVAGAVRLSDGRIAVANGGSKEIRIYGRDGRQTATVGRAGSGPGELRFLGWIGALQGDSIAVWDPSVPRLMVFAPGGTLAREATSTRPLGLMPAAVGALDGGAVVLATRDGFQAGAGNAVTRDTSAVVVLRPDGERVDSLGRFPGAEYFLSASQGATIPYPLAFGHQTLAAAHGNEVFVPSGTGYEVRVYRVPGGLARIIRVRAEVVPVTDADRREYRRTLVSEGIEGNPGMQARLRQILSEMPFPSTMAPITALVADSDGNLWVQEAAPMQAPDTRWRVLDPEGKAVAVVHLPKGLRVTQVGRDWVLGIVLDEDQAEHVQLYRLMRA
jgi:hypothetical protein